MARMKGDRKTETAVSRILILATGKTPWTPDSAVDLSVWEIVLGQSQLPLVIYPSGVR